MNKIPMNSIVFVFTIISLLIFGFDTTSYYLYNLEHPQHYVNSEIYEKDYIYSVIFEFMGHLYQFYLLKLQWIYQTPISYMLMAVIIRFLEVLLLYKIADFFLKNRNISLLIAFIYTLSVPIEFHGWTLNAAYGGLGFFRTSISLIAVLTAIYYTLKQKTLLPIVLFIIAIEFHPMHGLSSMLFFIVGYFFYIFFNQKEIEYKKQVVLIGISVLSYLLYMLIKTNFDLPILTLSDKSWLGINSASAGGDNYMFFTMQNIAYIFMPFLLLATFLSFKNTPILIKYLLVASCGLIIVVLLMEMFSLNEIFFGKITELLFKIEIRRGFGIVFLFILVVFGFLLKEKNLKEISQLEYLIYFSLMWLFILPSIYVLSIIWGLVSFYFWQQKQVKNLVFIGLLFVVSILLYQLKWQVDIRNNLGTLVLLGGLMIIFFFKNKFNKTVLMFAPVILFLIVTLSYSSLISHKFYKTSSWLLSNGLTNVPNLYGCDKDFQFYCNSVEVEKNYSDILLKLKKLNTKKEIILHPFYEVGSPGILSHSPIFLGEYEITAAFRSKKYMEYWNYRMNAVFDKSLTYFYPSEYRFLNFVEFQKNENKKFSQKIKKQYQQINLKKLKELKQKHNISWFISDGKRDDIKAIYCNNKFCLFKIDSLLKEDKK